MEQTITDGMLTVHSSYYTKELVPAIFSWENGDDYVVFANEKRMTRAPWLLVLDPEHFHRDDTTFTHQCGPVNPPEPASLPFVYFKRQLTPRDGGVDLSQLLVRETNSLSQHVCVDERMVGFKGRHHIVQYMAQRKAHRWGVKMWILAEAGTGYTHQVQIYLGKTLGGSPPKEGLGYGAVMDLSKGHHIVYENLFL